MTQSAAPSGDSARRADLLRALIDYSAEHGLSDVSLRPLAAAVGSSPRMLLYFFGSKEGLVREVLNRSREHQFELVDRWLHEATSPADRIERLWQWLADPEQAGIERLFFEGYARSLPDDAGAWSGFGAASITDWLPVIDRLLDPVARRSRGSGPMPTFVLATVRGLLLDLLATGDRRRVGRAFAVLADLLRRQERPAE
ncbi:MAG TPA: TetR/AcrR family transcriptional regulator [Jatrophihabitantaceae bacterium]